MSNFSDKLQQLHTRMAEGETFIANLIRDGFDDYATMKRQGSARANNIHWLFSTLIDHHFGIPPTIAQKQIVDLASDLIRDYYTTEWWRGHKQDRRHSHLSGERDDLTWMTPFRESLCLAALASRQDLLNMLGEWPEA